MKSKLNLSGNSTVSLLPVTEPVFMWPRDYMSLTSRAKRSFYTHRVDSSGSLETTRKSQWKIWVTWAFNYNGLFLSIHLAQLKLHSKIIEINSSSLWFCDKFLVRRFVTFNYKRIVSLTSCAGTSRIFCPKIAIFSEFQVYLSITQAK